MAGFGGFSRNVPRNGKFLKTSLTHCTTRHEISQLEVFFKNLQSVTVWLLNHCFRGKQWRGNIYFEKIVMMDFNLNFYRAKKHFLY